MESDQSLLLSPCCWLCLVMNYHRELWHWVATQEQERPLPWNLGTGSKVWVETAAVAGLTPLIFLCCKLYFWQEENQGWEILHFPGSDQVSGSRDTSPCVCKFGSNFYQEGRRSSAASGTYHTDSGEHRQAGQKEMESVGRSSHRDLSLWYACCRGDRENILLLFLWVAAVIHSCFPLEVGEVTAGYSWRREQNSMGCCSWIRGCLRKLKSHILLTEKRDYVLFCTTDLKPLLQAENRAAGRRQFLATDV